MSDEQHEVENDFAQAVRALGHGIAQEADAVFDELDRRLAGAYLALDPQAQPSQDRRYDVHGVQIAISLRRDSLSIGMYADLGVPLPGQERPAYVKLLELNHSGTHRPVRFGRHPHSGRLLACVQMPLLSLRLDPDCGKRQIAALAEIALAVRRAQPNV